MAVLIRTAVRFSWRTTFKNHPSVLPKTSRRGTSSMHRHRLPFTSNAMSSSTTVLFWGYSVSFCFLQTYFLLLSLYYLIRKKRTGRIDGAVSPLRIWWHWFLIAVVTNTTFHILRWGTSATGFVTGLLPHWRVRDK